MYPIVFAARSANSICIIIKLALKKKVEFLQEKAVEITNIKGEK
jgi:hypothetical protein